MSDAEKPLTEDDLEDYCRQHARAALGVASGASPKFGRAIKRQQDVANVGMEAGVVGTLIALRRLGLIPEPEQ